MKGTDEEKEAAAKRFAEISHGEGSGSMCCLQLQTHIHAMQESEQRLASHNLLLCTAYEVLSDEEKRKIYDRYGEDGLKQHSQNGGGGSGGPGDIFSQCEPSPACVPAHLHACGFYIPKRMSTIILELGMFSQLALPQNLTCLAHPCISHRMPYA